MATLDQISARQKIRMQYVYFKDLKLNNNNEVTNLEKIAPDIFWLHT